MSLMRLLIFSIQLNFEGSMNKKAQKVLIEVIKAIVIALAGYFGGNAMV